jgi:hypothetical protein
VTLRPLSEAFVGADAVVGFVSTTLARAVTVHHVERLELTTGDTARAVGAMHDVVRFVPGLTMHDHGHGHDHDHDHDHETYERSEDGGKVATSTLTRRREEIATPRSTVVVSDRRGRRFARASRRFVTPDGAAEGDELLRRSPLASSRDSICDDGTRP